MGGLECATQIRRRNIDIPIIAVTANARIEQVQEVSEQGQRSCQSAEIRGPYADHGLRHECSRCKTFFNGRADETDVAVGRRKGGGGSLDYFRLRAGYHGCRNFCFVATEK